MEITNAQVALIAVALNSAGKLSNTSSLKRDADELLKWLEDNE